MKFKDVRPGNLFTFRGTSSYYLKTKHYEGFIPIFSKNSNEYGGIPLDLLKDGLANLKYLQIFEFGEEDDVTKIDKIFD
jgi:hypothetical protein